MSKWLLVTGASSGIGSEIVRYLDSKGYNLVLTGRSKEKLHNVQCSLINDSLILPIDLQNLQEIETLFKKIKENSIKLGGMVHCAGVGTNLPIRSNNIEDMKSTMTTNYFSFVELGKYFSKKNYSLDESSIIAISSISPLTCYTGACNYAASKSAINTAVKIMAKEFMRRKIRVNAILPAYVNTPLGPAEDDELYVQQQPLGIIRAEYIAYLVEYLLSEKSRYMTGTLIPMSGGMTY